jgi:hypothetical protein
MKLRVTSDSVKPLLATSDTAFQAPPPRRRATNRGARATLLAVMLLSSPVACRQLVGFEDGPSSSSAGAKGYLSSAGYWPFKDPVCGACIDRSCAAEAKACAADSSCQAFEGCLAGCAPADSACAESCLTRVRLAGLSLETQLLGHCQTAACSTECPSFQVSLGDGQSCGPLRVSSACQACCCDEFAACDSNPECLGETYCSRQCGRGDTLGNSCFRACMGGAVDSPSPSLDPIPQCLFGGGRCQSQCFNEDDWTCLGRVQWPDPSEGWGSLYGTVIDNPGGAALEGFRIRGCVPRDQCDKPFAETKSDPDGTFFLDISKSPFGTTAYVEVSAPSGLNYPKHLFFEPPDVFNHAARLDYYVYVRESYNSVPLPDPTLGGLLFFTYDCSGRRVAGVEVTPSPAGSSDPPAYVIPGLRADPRDTATLPAGIGFIKNLPPGQVTLSMRRQSTQESIGIQRVVIEADAMTIVDLFPTPL